MRNILAAILFLLFALSSPAQQTGTTGHQPTIVCGQVINQTSETPKVITVLSCDPLNENNRYAIRLDSTGVFRAEFDMLWGHSFTINYDKNLLTPMLV